MTIITQWEGRRGLYRRYTGQLTIEDIMRANMEVMGDERSDDLRYVIADFLGVERSDIGYEDLVKINTFDTPVVKNMPNLRVAFVVRSETQQALAKLYELHPPNSSWQIQLFDNVEEARQWASDGTSNP